MFCRGCQRAAGRFSRRQRPRRQLRRRRDCDHATGRQSLLPARPGRTDRCTGWPRRHPDGRHTVRSPDRPNRGSDTGDFNRADQVCTQHARTRGPFRRQFQPRGDGRDRDDTRRAARRTGRLGEPARTAADGHLWRTGHVPYERRGRPGRFRYRLPIPTAIRWCTSRTPMS